MSYRHTSYRKMSAVVKKTAGMSSGEIADLPRHDMDRVLHWSNQRPLPKAPSWGKPKGWTWPEGAACTDCAPDGVCEQACTDVPRNGKAKPRRAA